MVSSPSLVTLVSWSVVKVLCSEGFRRFLLSTRPFSEEGWYWRSRMHLENPCLIGSWLDSEEDMKPCQVGTSLGEWLKGGWSYTSSLSACFGLFGVKLEKGIAFRNQTFCAWGSAELQPGVAVLLKGFAFSLWDWVSRATFNRKLNKDRKL